jgi:hypothetical protein
MSPLCTSMAVTARSERIVCASVEPLLKRIEASAEQGAYLAVFVLPDLQERSVMAKGSGDDVTIPTANLIAGWSTDSSSFKAVSDALRGFDRARIAVGDAVPQLQDVEGGWDVGLGNVVLDAGGVPACVAHGQMTGVAGIYHCTECDARALFDG